MSTPKWPVSSTPQRWPEQSGSGLNPPNCHVVGHEDAQLEVVGVTFNADWNRDAYVVRCPVDGKTYEALSGGISSGSEDVGGIIKDLP
jgi:hypothetical protein